MQDIRYRIYDWNVEIKTFQVQGSGQVRVPAKQQYVKSRLMETSSGGAETKSKRQNDGRERIKQVPPERFPEEKQRGRNRKEARKVSPQDAKYI